MKMKKPNIRLKIFNKNGKEVHRYHSRRKKSVLGRINRFYKRGFTVNIMVRYASGFHNEGKYSKKRDLIFAYRAFTEKDLVKEFM